MKRSIRDDVPPAHLPPGWSARERALATILIGVTSVMNLLDRQVLSILVEPIKAEFQLSDTQLGLLTGAGFAVPYALAAFPLAILIDRGVRQRIFGLAIAAWSLCTMLSGLALSYPALFAARMGVAIGEASATPAQSSLLADLHVGPRLSSVMAILPIGGAVGAAIALMLGGALTEAYGWRVALFAIGAPGLLVAAAMLLGMREPPRRTAAGAAAGDRAEPVGLTFRYLISLPALTLLVIANMAAGLSGYVFLVWTPSLLVRIHHMPLSEVGLWLGPLSAAGMIAGAMLGGQLGTRLGGRDMTWNVRVGGIACLIAFPAAVGLAFAPNATLAIAAMVTATTFNVVYLAPSAAQVQMLAPVRMRATAVALIGFWQTIAGVGLGPVLVGVISDHLRPEFGEDSLRYAMAASATGCAVAGIALLAAARYVKGDCARTLAREAG